MKTFIRTLSLALTLVMLTATVFSLPATALEVEDYYLGENARYGDVDNDLKITVKDSTAIQKHLAKIIELERRPQLIADVDGNGKLTISDATDIQKYLANIIHCFEVAPTAYCEADGEPVRVELTTEEDEKVTVKIPQEGFYRFMSRKVEGGPCEFDVSNEINKIAWAYGDASIVETYLYLTPGRYVVSIAPSWEYEKDVIDFSVTSASDDKMSFDVNNAKEMSFGDEFIIQAGGEPVIKLNCQSSDDLFYVTAEGEDPKVTFEFYNEYMQLEGEREPHEDGNTSTGYLNCSMYIVAKQEKGGSDYTLKASSFMTDLENEAKEITLNTPVTIKLTNLEDELNYGYSTYKFTPQQDGYYKLTASSESHEKFIAYVGANVTYNIYPDALKFYFFSKNWYEDVDIAECIEYLEAGKTYLMSLNFSSYETDKIDAVISTSDEEEYYKWYEKAYLDYSEGKEITDYTDIALGDREFVTIKSECDEEGWYNAESVFYKFTADKDMTVVAYSEGSYDACAYIYDENCGFTDYTDNSGSLSEDFATAVTLKAGESCYFELTSDDCYEYDDSYYFSIVDIEDYTSLS